MAHPPPRRPAPAHHQARHRIRLEWGPTGGAAVVEGADIAVVVDVLSFTTSLSVAVSRGTLVHPFAWRDERAQQYADQRDAVLAVGRLEARLLAEPAPSLSPAHLLAGPQVARLVLPSPNGSTICSALRAGAPDLLVVGAALRNRSAVARWLVHRIEEGASVAVVPAGERWPDDSLRPAVEDLWGAGAVLDALPASLAGLLAPEARHALAAYRAVAGTLSGALDECASGQELIDLGFGADVVVAADLDADDVVPVLTGDGFAPAERY
ncbi:2-phosphosulfolactate phosphatase [Nocardioides nitrophenolicus]|uniref:2-phosphosulfolactate phosphatase n=1 Tax=Nocardioides nitrophenolicus TaxID=60489 RepID=UPI00195ECE61|nr:2-phosphosulfolactate phosphatase [Nocardioides nitrophenolicus]MBM7520274.1 2-phosphosulfolactate phosphatase [Nocardioides nitrophenolicus]